MSHQTRIGSIKRNNSGRQEERKCCYCKGLTNEYSHSEYECPLAEQADREIEEEKKARKMERKKNRASGSKIDSSSEEEEPYWVNGPWTYGRGKCHWCEDTPIEYTHFEYECPLLEHEEKKQKKYERKLKSKIQQIKSRGSDSNNNTTKQKNCN